MIHTVGPVWHGGQANEAALLAACYRNSLQLAAEHGIKRIAFPAISTGVYGYPLDEATRIAINTVREVTEDAAMPQEVIFCCYSAHDFALYEGEMLAPPGLGT